VPVDDLDRCTPEEAMQLLFALRIMITGESLSFVVAADKNILAKFCNSVYGAMFTDIQAKEVLLSFFNDWVHLPSPPLLSVMKKVDFPLSIRDDFFRELETTGLTEIFPITSPVIQGCKRFELFMYNETFNSDVTVGDYCAWLGWFLISEIHPELIEEIIKSDKPEEYLEKHTDDCSEEKPDSVSEDSVRTYERISINQRKPKKKPGKGARKGDLLYLFKTCMSARMNSTGLVKKLNYIYPFL
jgi:hypothetical protein